MANFTNAIKSLVGVQNYNSFDLSCDNITSNDFFQFKPVYIRELVPGSKIHINMNQFTRLTPLVKPMYGNCKFVNRAFFVPMRTIAPQFNSFITQTVDEHSNTIPSIVASTYNAYLVNMFINQNPTGGYRFTDKVAENDDILVSPGVAFDFAYDSQEGNNNIKYYKFTRAGQKVYDILINLGYKIDFLYKYSDHTNLRMSMLPLLALYKIHYDWYRLSQFNISSKIKSDFDSQYDDNDIRAMLIDLLHVPYERDYFTSAWVNPSGPVSSVKPSLSITDATLPNRPTSSKSKVDTNTLSADGTPVVLTESGSQYPSLLTQYIDSALHHATDFIKRYQLFGSRTKDIYKSIFGIDLNDTALNRSVHIGKGISQVNIADVMQTASENGVGLGDYAGKGFASGNGSFSYKTDEFGYIIIVSVLVPKIMYTDGLDRMIEHLTPLKFFTPDFDRLGVQPISCRELIGNCGTRFLPEQDDFDPDQVFGFTSRYAEYKQATTSDKLSGLFALRSMNGDKRFDCYHFARYFNLSEVSDLISSTFCTASTGQFDRIFADNSDASDHFITIYHFDVKCDQPMSKLYDDYEWSECNGKEQVQPLGGTMLE